jgi:hypothetical protein
MRLTVATAPRVVRDMLQASGGTLGDILLDYIAGRDAAGMQKPLL